MKKLLILTIFILASLSGFTQNQSNIGLSDVEFNKAKIEFAKLTKTESYIEDRKVACEIVVKSNQKLGPNLASEEWVSWISENIKKTKFKSVEEAIHLRATSLWLTKKNIDDNFVLFEMIKRATPQQQYEILEPERLLKINY